MSALAFALGMAYVLIGIVALMIAADHCGSRIGAKLEGLLLAQLLALALWPITLLIDALLLRLRPRNRRCAP